MESIQQVFVCGSIVMFFVCPSEVDILFLWVKCFQNTGDMWVTIDHYNFDHD